jgi:hypothetical protein
VSGIELSMGYQGIEMIATGELYDSEFYREGAVMIELKRLSEVDELIEKLVAIRNKVYPYPLLKVEVEK